jgi:predicted transcriptional regulator
LARLLGHCILEPPCLTVRAGEAIGYLLLAGGVLLVFGGALITGVWFAAIGWFLAQTARASYLDFEAREAMHAVDVEAVMERGLLSVPADATVQETVEDYLLRHDQDVFPVDQDGSTVGIITGRLVQAVPRNERATRLVRDAMVPVEKLDVVRPGARMNAVLDRLGEVGDGFALVVDDGRAVGLVTLADVTRWIRRRDSLAA